MYSNIYIRPFSLKGGRMYFLTITNPQDEKIRLVFDNVSQLEEFMEQVIDTGNPCLYQIYSDEYQTIKINQNTRG